MKIYFYSSVCTHCSCKTRHCKSTWFAFFFGQNQSSLTGHQWYSDPSPYGDCSLMAPLVQQSSFSDQHASHRWTTSRATFKGQWDWNFPNALGRRECRHWRGSCPEKAFWVFCDKISKISLLTCIYCQCVIIGTTLGRFQLFKKSNIWI